MKTLRGTTIVESGCLDPDLNIFYSKSSDGRTYVLRQPRKKDSGEQRKAWKQLSAENKRWYMRKYPNTEWLYSVNQRCRAPLYRGEVPGVLPLTVEVDGEVVGFCDAFFNTGEYFAHYQVEPECTCINCSITALDKFIGMGIGYYYSNTSNEIGRHFGCKYILGRTKQVGGMRQIRIKDGWIATGYDKDATGTIWVSHKKIL